MGGVDVSRHEFSNPSFNILFRFYSLVVDGIGWQAVGTTLNAIVSEELCGIEVKVTLGGE